MQVRICKKVLFLECAASFLLMTSKTGYEKGGGAAGGGGAVSSIPTTGKVRRLPDEIKLYTDGAVISLLMQMKDGYHGEWIMKPDDFAQAFKVYWGCWVPDSYPHDGRRGTGTGSLYPGTEPQGRSRVDHRTVIVHFANSTDAQVARIAKDGAIVSGNPYYVNGFADSFGVNGLGKDRADSMVRLGPVERRAFLYPCTRICLWGLPTRSISLGAQ